MHTPIVTMGAFYCPETGMTKQPSDERPYLNVDEVARRFGVNVTTVYRLVQRGKLPAFKIGNQWRFSEARLEEWVADRERIG
jgi:excisionase family DNA binding protein